VPCLRTSQTKANRLAQTPDGMANRIGGDVTEPKGNIDDAFKHLEQAVRTEPPTPELQTFLRLSRNIESVTSFLNNRI
jgi:hypothetical protein